MDEKEVAARIDQLQMLVLVLRHLDPAPDLKVFGVINDEIKHLKKGGDYPYRMTGQDWYERFWVEYEADEQPKIIDSTLVREQVDRVARRASGTA